MRVVLCVVLHNLTSRVVLVVELLRDGDGIVYCLLPLARTPVAEKTQFRIILLLLCIVAPSLLFLVPGLLFLVTWLLRPFFSYYASSFFLAASPASPATRLTGRTLTSSPLWFVCVASTIVLIIYFSQVSEIYTLFLP